MDGETIRREMWALVNAAIAQVRVEEREACCVAVREACTMCRGTGGEDIPGGRVTRDMALDAGDLAMEGHPLPGRSYECEYCGQPIAAIRARGTP